jgi:hypothetical protein
MQSDTIRLPENNLFTRTEIKGGKVENASLTPTDFKKEVYAIRITHLLCVCVCVCEYMCVCE